MENVNGYEKLMRNNGLAGFAHLYLHQFNRGSNPEEEIDIEVYTKARYNLDSSLER